MSCGHDGKLYEPGEYVRYTTHYNSERKMVCTGTSWRVIYDTVDTKRVEGVGPDAPVVENEKGGKQSHIPYRFDLIPPDVLFDVAATLAHGAEKYGPRNWMLIPIDDHYNHAMQHVYAWKSGDTTDDHLVHAIVRLMFALHLDKQEF